MSRRSGLHLSAAVLVVLFGLAISSKIIAQDSSTDGLTFALKQAAQFLSKQLGRPIPSVDNYCG